MFRKLMTVVLSFLLCFNAVFTVNVSAEENDNPEPEVVEPYSNDEAGDHEGLTIKHLNSTILSGFNYQNENGVYVWNADNTTNKRFVFRLDISTSAAGTALPGEIEIKIPASIFTNRNGDPASFIELSVPSKSEIEEEGDDLDPDLYWGYERHGDNIVIYNIKEVGAAQIAENYIELAYVTNKSIFEYKDMGSSNSIYTFWASVDYKDQHFDCDDIHITFDTAAVVNNTKKEYPNRRFTKWDNSWGDEVKPENPDDYYYLVWPITSSISATQPYTFSLADSVKGGVVASSTPFDKQGDYEAVDDAVKVLGYRFSGQQYFSTNTMIEGQTQTGNRYDNVLTALDKNTFKEENLKWIIDNSIESSLHPYDDIDPDSSSSSSRRWTWEAPSFNYGTWGLEVFKNAGLSNYSKSAIIRYDLQKFNGYDGADIVFNEEYNGFSYTTGMYLNGAGILTTDTPEDPDSYKPDSKKTIRYLFEDRYFDMETGQKDVVLSNQTTGESMALSKGDFCFYRLNYELILTDASLNAETMRLENREPVYQDYDVLRFYGKFGNSNTYVEFASRSYKTNEIKYDEDYVESMNDSEIVFKEGADLVAYQVETDNAHYFTRINLTPYVKLYASDAVKELVKDAETIMISNNVKGTVYRCTEDDKEGKEITHKVAKADDLATVTCEIRESMIKKRVISSSNNTRKRLFRITWGIEAYETMHTNSGSYFGYVHQDSGVVYDLVPKGSIIDFKSIDVKADERSLASEYYEISTVENYNDTGRTLLVVRVNKDADKYNVFFDTTYHWNSIFDYGKSVYNPVAYETGNESITGGSKDDGGKINEADLMKDLDPKCEGDRFIYNQYTYNLNTLLSASSGLNKKAKDDEDVVYTYEVDTEIKSDYSYQLRFQNNSIAKAKDIVIFDNIENYYIDNQKTSDWIGTITSFDLSQLKDRGIAPVVYFSNENIDIEEHHDLSDNTIWTVLNDTTDLSRIRSFAIDASKAYDGSDYILDVSKSIVVNVHMKAPNVSPETNGTYPETYNGVYMSNTIVQDDNNGGYTEIEMPLVHNEYTVVRLVATGSFGLTKVSAEDENEVIPGITFRLFGTSDYGSLVDVKTVTDSNGQIYFKDVEKGKYILQEYKCSEDWLLDTTEYRIAVDSEGTVTVNGTEFSDSYITIANTPRIHGDLRFKKANYADRFTGINDALFELKGTSDYGNDVHMYARSLNGQTRFNNIELGTYELKEVSAPEGYVNNGLTFKVRLNEDGDLLFVSAFDNDGKQIRLSESDYFERNGNGYSIFNEDKYHDLYFFKIDSNCDLVSDPMIAIPLEDAEFRLYGTSDLGSEIDLTVKSDENGKVEFTNVEKGIYILEETVVPVWTKDDGSNGNYCSNDTKYTVTVKADNTFVIEVESENLLTDRNGVYYITNTKENSDITVTKKWEGGDSNDRPIPQFRLTGTPEKDDAIKTSLSLSSVTEHALDKAAKIASSVLSTFMPSVVHAEEDDPIVGQVFYYLDNSNHILYLSNSNAVAEATEIAESTRWHSYYGKLLPNNTAKTITKVVILNRLMPTSMAGWFYYFEGLTEIQNMEYLDTSHVTNMSSMFEYCEALPVIDVSGFDTSKVTDMSGMFAWTLGVTELDLSSFNTSNVTDMSNMFHVSKVQKINLSSFNTSKVTTMKSMFDNCTTLKEIDLSGFDTSNVTDMSRMFDYCSSLTELDLSNFSAKKVASMYSMFADCGRLGSVDLSGFGVSPVTEMQGMFRECRYLKSIDLSNLETPVLKNTSYMFYRCTALQDVDISKLITSNVTDMSKMFEYCQSLTSLDLSNFDTSNVTNMQEMFIYCTRLEKLNLSSFRTPKLSNMTSMFANCEKLEVLDLSNFDTSNVGSYYFVGLFSGCKSLRELYLHNFNTSKATQMSSMFANCENLEVLDISNFDTKNVTTMNAMFSGCKKLQELDVSKFDTSKVTDMNNMFNGCSSLAELDLSNFDTENVKSMNCMFANCLNISEIDIAHFKTSQVTNMGTMFLNCTNLANIDVSGFDTSNVAYINHMFDGCKMLESVDVSGFDTSNVVYMQRMFANCTNLKDLDVSKFVTSKVTSMREMFYNCENLKKLDVSNFDTGNVSDMYQMFYGCKNVDHLDVSSFDTSKVTNMYNMFWRCQTIKDLDLSNFDFSKCTNIMYLVGSCKNLSNIDISGLDTSSLNSNPDLFFGDQNISYIKVGDKYEVKYNNLWPYGTWTKIRDVNGTRISDNSEYADKTMNDMYLKSGEYTAGVWSRDGADPRFTDPATGQVTYKSDDDFWTQVDEDTWTYTFIVEDETLNYYLYEFDSSNAMSDVGYSSPNLSEKDELSIAEAKEKGVKVTNGTAVITNTFNTEEPDPENPGTVEPTPVTKGSLTISKEVEGAPADRNDKFAFVVTLTDKNDEELSGRSFLDVDISGTISTVLMNDGEFTIWLKGGETATIAGLEDGIRYRVEELPSGVYDLKDPDIIHTGTIEASKTSSELFVNVYNDIDSSGVPVTPVKLTVSKSVVGNTNLNNEYSINVILEDLYPNTMYSYKYNSIDDELTYVSDSTGKALVSLKLKDRVSAEFDVMPGTKYTVYEEAGDYVSSYKITDQSADAQIVKAEGSASRENNQLSTETEMADFGEDTTITFTNVFTDTVLQNLTLTKMIAKQEGDDLVEVGADDEDYRLFNETEYVFNITFYGLPEGSTINSDEGKIVFEDDSRAYRSVTLKNGESFNITDIPVGVSYRISETRNSLTASSFDIYRAVSNAPISMGANRMDDGKLILDKSLTTPETTVVAGSNDSVVFTNIIPEDEVPVTEIGVVKNYSEIINGKTLTGYLPGAEFTLCRMTGVAVAEKYVKTTDVDGKALFEGLGEGHYILKETFAPDGYVVAEDTEFDVIVESGAAKAVLADSVKTKDDSILVSDPILKGTMVLNKKGMIISDYNVSEETGNLITNAFNWVFGGLKDATFALYAAEDIVYEGTQVYAKDDVIAEATSDKNGIVTFTDLLAGKYYVVEKKTDKNHVLDDERIDIEMMMIFESSMWQLKADQIPEIINVLKNVSVSIEKKDENGSSLAGAVFGLYAAEDSEYFEADELLESVMSNEDGKAAFTKSLPVGEYYVKEIKAPQGYELDETRRKVSFSEDGTVYEFVITNRMTKIVEPSNPATGNPVYIVPSTDVK